MKKGLRYLVSSILIIAFLLLGSVVNYASVDFPAVPNVWDSVDSFYTYSVGENQNLYINRVYCFVINEKSVVNEFYPDNGFDYVMCYWLIQREDGQLVQEKYPNAYFFDADADGNFAPDESLFEKIPDGWNGNEVDIYESENLPTQ